MAYLDTNQQASPGSLAGVIIVHTAIGGLLLAGLNIDAIIEPEDGPLTIYDVKDETPPPPPPPPPPTDTVTPNVNPITPPITVPKPLIDVPVPRPMIDTTDLILPPAPTPKPGPRVDPVIPSPVPSIDPVAAKPRNDPASWITTDDYRPSWLRREIAGRASFRLDIAANGKVTGCTITASTGHRELDQATCSLVQRRAKFQPARGREGEPVAATYTQSIVWQIPD